MGIIRAAVRTRDDKPIAGATLTFKAEAGSDQARVRTDVEGKLQTGVLPAGTYTWQAQKAGFLPLTGRTPALRDGERPTDLGRIVMERAGVIQGRVTADDGHPLPGVRVTATSGVLRAPRRTDTGALGDYSFGTLPPGPYRIAVEPPVGFQQAQPLEREVASGQEVRDADFLLQPEAPPPPPVVPPGSAITGRVTSAARDPVLGAVVSVRDDRDHLVVPTVVTDAAGVYTVDVPAGVHKVQVDQPAGYLPARNVAVEPNDRVDGIDFSLDPVANLLGRLDDRRFDLESPISEEEARQAIHLFSVVTLRLAGQVGDSPAVGRSGLPPERLDVLGMRKLYYGLQDGSLRRLLTFVDEALAWSQLEGDLRDLVRDSERLQADLEFLDREARRQFNLGRSNGVLANVVFPPLFRRYVEIAVDPRLAIDIRTEQRNPAFDPTRLAEVDMLLGELKSLILQLVSSLSRFGTVATRRLNEQWADFETGAAEVLATVAQYRVSPDLDQRNPWVVLTELAGKDFATEVAPYVALARHGGKLLQYALAIYRQAQRQLSAFDADHLHDLFQTRGTEFWTQRLRKEAGVIQRYPLRTWG